MDKNVWEVAHRGGCCVPGIIKRSETHRIGRQPRKGKP
jgi:hypothetical protein